MRKLQTTEYPFTQLTASVWVTNHKINTHSHNSRVQTAQSGCCCCIWLPISKHRELPLQPQRKTALEIKRKAKAV